LLNARAGLVNYSLSLIGIEAPNWLAAPKTALIALIWVDIWQWTPFVMVIFVTPYRYFSDRLTWSAYSSQFLEHKKLFWGSNAWHYGIIWYCRPPGGFIAPSS
jgi:hypothetical protein